MALVPYTITALAESDAVGTDGKNIVAGAVCSMYSQPSDTVVTLYDDAAGNNGSTSKVTGANGQVVVYVVPGSYRVSVNAVDSYALVGTEKQTTLELINSTSPYQAGDTVTTSGFTTAGDGGGAQWLATATTGQTPSQTPAQLADAELTDGSGRKWKYLPPLGLTSKQINVYALGAKDSTASGAAIQASLNSAVGGGSIVCGPDEFLIEQELLVQDSVTIYGNNAIFRADDSLGNDFELLRFESPSMPTRSVTGGIYDVNFKGNGITPERWLQDSNGNAIADPEADYVAGTGALASGITGVSLTAALTGDSVSSVVINTGGSGWNGHPTDPYVPSEVPLNFDGDGFGARGYATISEGTLTSITLESGGYGYTVAPTVTTLGGYADIDLLLNPSVDRRNADHIVVANILQLTGVFDFSVEGCSFSEHVGRAILEQGGLNVSINKNLFDQVGKNDQAFHAIFTQSFGTPGLGQSFYSPSENIKVTNNRAFNLERSFCAFAPTKGGELSGNYVDGWGESCIFINANALFDGGEIYIKNNIFKNGLITDIVCEAVETNAVGNIFIYDNSVESSDGGAFGCAGLVDSTVKNNVLKNVYRNHSIQYGPFSERYSFNPGQRPIAGNELHVKEGYYITVGTFTGVGNDNLYISENIISEDRADFPYIFKQTKSGGNNLSTGCFIEKNRLSVPSGMLFINTDIGDVWDTNIPLFIKHNYGHESEAPVVDLQTVTATGLVDIEVGFRPSWVDVYSSDNNALLGRIAVGSFSWNRAASRNDFSLHGSFDSVGEYGFILDQEVVRLTDSSGTATLSVEFVKWVEKGFQVNVLSLTGGDKRIRFVCHP